ncbi:MAG: ATP-dependent helicase HrpB [Rhodobacterales bacterium]|nr:MAG: ATP-dependent helicase HrpB [Rhodobacterales bacterium]
MNLPIDPLLPDIKAALLDHGRAVLQAPPGAGKTTRVPLALMDAFPGKIVMLEPRRIAARAAAERLASQLGEAPGTRVGYRMRGESVAGSRIEVVTEGILTRMLQSDPELPGISVVIFDEFHERSLNADLGLALTVEARAALREDLALLVMSATLDAGPVADLLDGAPVLTSDGRSYPVDIRHLPRPMRRGTRLAPAMADLIVQAAQETDGGILAFLPGEREIRDCAARLAPRLPEGCVIRPLYGALPFAAQQEAIRPERGARKVVLATSIAETSLTIEDIRVVVDAGKARRARFDPATGMSRLVTEPASRAEITQRAGRAGRMAPGQCYRLWAAAEEGALPAHAPPEIAVADLTGLALELAQWGASDLPFLTPPPEGALSEARALLTDLGALSGGAITAHGRAMAKVPLHPRLAHMLITGGGADLAALLSERDPLRGAGADLTLRLKAMQGRYTGPGEVHAQTIKRLKGEAKRLSRFAKATDLSPGARAALAYPDRIGLRRKGDAPRWLLSGGRGAEMDAGDALAGMRMIVATELDGAGREARIRHALPISEPELRDLMPGQITWRETCYWSRREGKVLARRQEMLGQLVLQDTKWDAPPEAMAHAMLDGVREAGLRPSPAAERLRARVALTRAAGHDLPDMSDAALMETLDTWLLPHLTGITTAAQWRTFDLLPALQAMLDWGQTQTLNREAPAHFTTPLGRKVPIDYAGDHPEIALRLQELFGTTTHPTVAGRPLRLVLLSPAQRPIQVTMDLPGFWTSSYADLRKDMRGQYPKHPWPEDPREADPTTRAKPRKG